MHGTDSRSLRGRWTGLASSSISLGARPGLWEVRDYYLTPEILREFSHLTYVRDVELIYCNARQQEFHVGLGPQTAEELKLFFQRFFDPITELSHYPWLHCWSNRAYEIDPAHGQRRLIGFDSGRELDLSWRRSFAELYPGMRVLDELGITYRLKFSGHRSLHLCIPAEAVSERFRGDPNDWYSWRAAVNTVGSYVHRIGCGDELWSRMAGEEPFTGVYSVHRFCGLVSAPLRPSECEQFRPWMATVQLATAVQDWWDIPADAQDNFDRAVDRIRANTVVVDLNSARSLRDQTTPGAGFVANAMARARKLAATDSQGSQSERAAAWSSMVLGQPLPASDFRHALQSDDQDLLWFALEAGCADMDAKRLLLPILQRLAAGPRFVQEAATDCLMNMGDAGLVLLLESAGRKRQWKKKGSGPARHRRRFNVLWPLQHRVQEGGQAAAEQLARLAERQGSPAVCRAVCAVLERCGATGLATLALMLSSKSPFARQEALVTLMYNIDVALPTLQTCTRAAEGDEQDLMERLIEGGRRLQQSEVLCWTMRPSTLARVVSLGESRAAAQLGKELLSGDKREGYHASRGLVYTGQVAVAALLTPLQSPEPLVRRRACEALRDLAAAESRPALFGALEDSDVGVRINAVRALGRIGHAPDLELLRARSADPSRAVRRAIREAVGTATGASTTP